MLLEVPDEIVAGAETNAIELRILLAIQLYADNRLDHQNACRLAQVPTPVFNRELLRRAICIQQYPSSQSVERQRSAG